VNELLTEAHAYLALGYSVCPIDTRRNKAPHDQALVRTGHSEWRDNPHARRQVGIWRDLQHTRPTPEQLDLWFKDEEGHGMALVTGQLSGVVVLDFDGPPGVALMSHLKLRPHTRTPSGGYHVHFKHPGWPVRTVASKSLRDGSLPGGLDVRGDGGMAMLPPSFVPEKGYYTRLRDPADLELALTLPEDLRIATGLHAPPRARETSLPTITDIPSGDRWPSDDLLFRALEKVKAGAGRNDTGFWLARTLYANGYSEGELMELGARYIDHVPDANTKGQRESYSLTHYAASVRQVLRNPRGPAWVKRDQKERKKDAPNAFWVMQEKWPEYSESRRAALVRAVALLWYEEKPVEQVVTFFKLLGYDARRIARDAYTEGAGGLRGSYRALLNLVD
jgi:hypothetical protein